MVWPNRGAISVIGGYGLNVLKLLQGGHRCCRYASVRLQQGSEDYPATPSTIARILCRGPGQARLGLVPLPVGQRGMERRAAQPSVQRLAALPRLARARIATRRSIAAFLSPAPCFREAQRRQTSLRPGRLPPPVVAPASSHRRQPVLVPADDWPRPPGPAVTSRSGGRRILLRLQDRL